MLLTARLVWGGYRERNADLTPHKRPGKLGELLSGGFIPIENIIIGIEVCASISIIFVALLAFKIEESE